MSSDVRSVSLYHLPLLSPPLLHHAISGSFTAEGLHELIFSHGGSELSLYRPDETGRMNRILSVPVFGQIRSVVPFRLPNATLDAIIVGSDSGRISIIQYDAKRSEFIIVHQETFGKSGCRRVVPGEYLACDPRGRAAMIAAVEKSKLVYILHQDAEKRMTISSPLQANQAETMTISLVGLDVAWENPIFAAIECEYEKATENEAEQRNTMPPKQLALYELDVGINTVSRKSTYPLPPSANLLISVPGHEDGPGGVLICCENYLIYKNFDSNTHLEIPYPKRKWNNTLEKGTLIVCHSVHIQRGFFMFLLQSEYGDLYKVSMDWKDKQVSEVKVSYFDTFPTANAICVLKSGFLFSASEAGNSYLFQFIGLGQDETCLNSSKSGNNSTAVAEFVPRHWKNLVLVHELEAGAPVIDMKIADLTKENSSQIYLACGRGARSTLRLLRYGLPVAELAVSELPGNPTNLWTVRRSAAEPDTGFIFVSTKDSTIALSVGESVNEVFDSGIVANSPTLAIYSLVDSSIVQILPYAVVHVMPDKKSSIWEVPGKRGISASAGNNKQVVIALNGGSIINLQLDSTGKLVDTSRQELGNDVAALAVSSAEDGPTTLAVGGYDRKVRILAIDPSGAVQDPSDASIQALTEIPHSLLITRNRPANEAPVSYLYVGQANGVLIRTQIDTLTGALMDSRKRFLGPKSVRLTKVAACGQEAVLAFSTRIWISYFNSGRLELHPLSYEIAEHGAAFSSPLCPEGFILLCANMLRIIAVERFGEIFNQISLPLSYTPRKILIPPSYSHLIVLESDHNAFSERMRLELKRVNELRESELPPEAITGTPQAGEGNWASCIRIVDPVRLETNFVLELEDNGAAFSGCCFSDAENKEHYLAVGVVNDYDIQSRSFSSAWIHLYRVVTDLKLKVIMTLQFVHKTQVNDVPLAMHGFNGKLLAGVGKSLRLYEIGRKKLLRKSENRNFPTCIQSLQVNGNRIVVGDMCESFQFVQYRTDSKELEILADSTAPRYLTCSTMTDFDTAAGADKFGNFFLSRIPPGLNDVALANASAAQSRWTKYLQGSPIKLADIAQFHLGAPITGMQLTSLTPGGEDILIYATITGGIGVFMPFKNRDEVELFTQFEMAMRRAKTPLCGRDHLAYRSAYFPVKNVVDGELCELIHGLEGPKQSELAESLGAAPADIKRKLEEMRNRVL